MNAFSPIQLIMSQVPIEALTVDVVPPPDRNRKGPHPPKVASFEILIDLIAHPFLLQRRSTKATIQEWKASGKPESASVGDADSVESRMPKCTAEVSPFRTR